MARARELTRRGSGSGDETTTGEPIAPAATNGTGGDGDDGRSVGRRVMNWLGYGLDEPGSNEGSTENPTTEFVPTAEVAVTEVAEAPEATDAPESTEATDATEATAVADVADEAIDTDPESPAWYPTESRNGGNTEERIEAAVASAAHAAEERAMEEILALEEDLERAKEEASMRLADLEEQLALAEARAQEAEQAREEADGRAAEAAERLAALEAAASGEPTRGEIEERARGEAEATARAETERILAEVEERAQRQVEAAEERFAAELRGLQQEVERARVESEREARDAVRAREEELAREKARLEDELAAALRQLAEMYERAAAADRRATEIEISSHRGLPAPEPEVEAGAEPEPEPEGAAEAPSEPELTAAPASMPAEPISLAAASFDDLRRLGMSVTQAKRVLRYRDERGIADPHELDQLPGFPKGYLSDIKTQLVP